MAASIVDIVAGVVMQIASVITEPAGQERDLLPPHKRLGAALGLEQPQPFGDDTVANQLVPIAVRGLSDAAELGTGTANHVIARRAGGTEVARDDTARAVRQARATHSTVPTATIGYL